MAIPSQFIASVDQHVFLGPVLNTKYGNTIKNGGGHYRH